MREWLKELVSEAAQQMGSELQHMAAHGAHEVAATLFNGSAFVMYPRGHHDDPQISNAEHQHEQISNANHEPQHQIEREM